MKRRSISIGVVALISHTVLPAVNLSFAPGMSVWNIAAENNRISNTIESKLCDLQFKNDFSGTFTVLDTLLSKMCLVESKSEFFSTELDELQANVDFDLSKACAIEDTLNLIQLNLESLDVKGTFTVLDALKQTVCSKIELLNQQLSGVQIEVADLTATEIDHAATIASKLEVLDGEVVSINSILDALSFDLKLSTACSLLDVIDSCLDTVDSKVDLLDGVISVGFAGTFTALDVNLAKACTIESLVDALTASSIADLSGVFSSLAQLQEKVCTIESKVDDLPIITILSFIDIIDSQLDPLISKIDVIASQLPVLESKTDSTAGNPLFSLLDNAIQVLDQDCSILEVLNSNQMLEKSCTIESNLDAITTQLLTQESKLEIIDTDLQTVASKICAVEMDNLALSKLCLIDSKLDVEQNVALTIESIIDSLAVQGSDIDLIDDISQTIFSKLCLVDLESLTICSKLDALSPELQTVDSKLDITIPTAQSDLDSLIIIESSIDNVPLDQLVTNTLVSKLCVIEDQVCTIGSTLDIMGPLIGILNMQAQGLIEDFQETWTILQVTENKLCTSESVLDVVSIKLQAAVEVDLSGVFTAIEAIDQKAIIIDGKVNITDSLVEGLTEFDLDLSGIFTVLEVIQSKVCLADDLVQTISAGVEDIKDCLGTAIFQSDVGTSGFTINIAGRYYLAEPITFNPSVGGSAAITIATDNVTLDLSNYSIEQENAVSTTNGILVNNGLSNIRVENGTVIGTQGACILASPGAMRSSNLLFSNLFLKNAVGGTSSGLDCCDADNVIARNITAQNCGQDGIRFNDCNDIVSTFCVSLDNDDDGLSLIGTDRGSVAHFITENNGIDGVSTDTTSNLSLFIQCKTNNNAEEGIKLDSEAIIKNCIANNNNQAGIEISGTGSVIIKNSLLGNITQGIGMATDGGSATNTYVAFNSLTENGTNIDEAAGTNTYLGNFAFNSTAVGDPDNTNYDIDGSSDITRKFVTVSQASSFTDRPTYWHNINMLP